MTPEAWMIVIVAILGSNGLMATMLYAMRNKSDTLKINAESAKDTRIKQLEIQLERVKSNREKMVSDEKQSGELYALPTKFLDAYGKALEENSKFRIQIQDIQAQQQKIEATRELDYKRQIDVYDRHTREGITRDDNRDKALRAYIHTELDLAIAKSQEQTAARNFYVDYLRGFRYPPDHDPRWRLCTITLQNIIEAPIYDTPLHIMGAGVHGKIAKLVTGNTAWVIDEPLSAIPQWCVIRLPDMPELHGWCEARFLEMKECGKETPKAVNVP